MALPSPTSSTPSPSASSSSPSPPPSLSLRSIFVGTTIAALGFALVELLFRPGAWATLVGILAIPAVSISLSYFGGASIHTSIAYTTIRQEARRSRSEYLRLIETEILPPAIAQIRRDVQSQIRAIEIPKVPPFPTIPDYAPQLAELRAEIASRIAAVEGKIGAIQIPDVKAELATMERPNLAADLQAFLESDDGRAWTAVIAETAGQQAANVLTQRTTSAAGAVARHAQSKLYRLLDGHIQFGNPILDGAWAIAPPDVKRAFVNQLARILRQAGVVFPEDMSDIVDGEYTEAEPPMLEGGDVDPSSIEWPPRG